MLVNKISTKLLSLNFALTKTHAFFSWSYVNIPFVIQIALLIIFLFDYFVQYHLTNKDWFVRVLQQVFLLNVG